MLHQLLTWMGNLVNPSPFLSIPTTLMLTVKTRKNPTKPKESLGFLKSG
ncbi:MAG: hypothetical protein AB8B50_07350 [Pirellulaceae bacterium]